MFRDAADEDYLVARSSVQLGLIHQFCWSSQQCLEKYLKAILLLNGREISTNHSLMGMLETCREICGDLLPLVLCPIREFTWEGSITRRAFEPVEAYLARVEDYGNPHIRYRIYSITVSFYDLNKLDELCFMLRRVAFPLDIALDQLGMTAREYLQKNRALQIHSQMGFDKQPSNKTNSERTATFKWRNFSYAYDDAVAAGEIQTGGASSVNAEPYICLEKGEVGYKSLEWISPRAFPKSINKSITIEILSRRNKK